MLKRLTLICLLTISSAALVFADSPLTSTHFWTVYQASKDATPKFPPYEMFDASGWSDGVMAFLCNADIPVEHRLCLINYIGWDFNGQHHYPELVTYYVKHNGIDSKQHVFDGMSGEQMIVFAYVKAMDDYFDVRRADVLGKEAVRRSPDSRAVAMISALIRAQIDLDGDWENIYPVCHKVETNKNLRNDFSRECIDKIMEYINLYKGE